LKRKNRYENNQSNNRCIALLAGSLFAQTETIPSVDSVAPVVVKTVAEAGVKDVAAGEMEIKVTFSKEMTDNSWSWSTAWKDSTPTVIGKPRYDADKKTCILKVKLEPGKTYGYWINSQKFTGFRCKQGKAAIPYFFVFQTKN
jgi:hypothetical protein